LEKFTVRVPLYAIAEFVPWYDKPSVCAPPIHPGLGIEPNQEKVVDD